jgi:hypothetical protein
MRQAVIIGTTLGAAVALAQVLDRDPVPTSVIPLLWIVAALAVLVELVGPRTFLRLCRERRTLGVLTLAALAAVATLLVRVETPRLSASRSEPPSPLRWSTVQSAEFTLPLVPAARELYAALAAASNVEDLGACSAQAGPAASLGTRTRLQVGELISSPRVMVIPALRRLRDAVRAMERVPVFRQVKRTPPATTEEQRLVQIYDWTLTRSWLVARERRTAAGDTGPEPSLCVYGFADLSTKTILNEYDAALRAIPGS